MRYPPLDSFRFQPCSQNYGISLPTSPSFWQSAVAHLCQSEY